MLMSHSATGDTATAGVSRTERRVLAVLARRGRRAFMKDLVIAIDELDEHELRAMLAELKCRGLVSGPSGRLLEYGLTVKGWHSLRETEASRVAVDTRPELRSAGHPHRR